MHIVRHVYLQILNYQEKIKRKVYKLCKLHQLNMNFRDIGKVKSKWGTLGYKHILTTFILLRKSLFFIFDQVATSLYMHLARILPQVLLVFAI